MSVDEQRNLERHYTHRRNVFPWQQFWIVVLPVVPAAIVALAYITTLVVSHR